VVFLHGFSGEFQQVCGNEFLCKENLLEASESMGRYVCEG
jgi:hypothetical protein